MAETEYAFFNGAPAQEKVVELTGAEVGAEISGLASQLGRSATLEGGALEVTPVPEDPNEEISRLVDEHPHGELLVAVIDEKMDKQADKSWFKDELGDDDPVMQLPAGAESLDVMHKNGIITEEMRSEGKVNLVGVVWSSLANPRSSSPKQKQNNPETRDWVTGNNEALAIEIIKLKVQSFTKDQRRIREEAGPDND